MTHAEILTALYNASRPQGPFAMLSAPGDMTVEEAQAILDRWESTYFDYLNVRVMKIDVAEEPLDFRLYDRDLGEGAGQRAIDAFRGA